MEMYVQVDKAGARNRCVKMTWVNINNSNTMVDSHADKAVFDIGVYRRIKIDTHGYRGVFMSTRWRSICMYIGGYR